MRLPIIIVNCWTLFKNLMTMEITITTRREILLREIDGRLVTLDEWRGYNECARLGCGHYLCEHAFTTELPPEGAGEKAAPPIITDAGCGNAGCDCTGFLDKDKL